MRERADNAARALIGAVTAITAIINREATAWVRSGDTTLMVVLGVIALVLLVVIVVPGRRRY